MVARRRILVVPGVTAHSGHDDNFEVVESAGAVTHHAALEDASKRAVLLLAWHGTK